MRLLGTCLILTALVLSGLALGCGGSTTKGMKNAIVETGRTQDTRPIPINRQNTSKFMQAEPQGPKAPPVQRSD